MKNFTEENQDTCLPIVGLTPSRPPFLPPPAPKKERKIDFRKEKH